MPRRAHRDNDFGSVLLWVWKLSSTATRASRTPDGVLRYRPRRGKAAAPLRVLDRRAPTHDATRTTLSIVWGTRALPGRTQNATTWYREVVATIAGATLEDVAIVQAA
jgi:hypothetical protein